jgi:hypothetical protein
VIANLLAAVSSVQKQFIFQGRRVQYDCRIITSISAHYTTSGESIMLSASYGSDAKIESTHSQTQKRTLNVCKFRDQNAWRDWPYLY